MRGCAPVACGQGIFETFDLLGSGWTSSFSYRQATGPLTLLENSPSPANSEETKEEMVQFL
jgi:hypothetical protein